MLFGVELEVDNLNEYTARLAILRAKLEGLWEQKPECSVPYGREFNSPIMAWEDRWQCFEILKELRKSGGKCHQRCGIHIHISGYFPRYNAAIPTMKKWYAKHKNGFRPARRRRRVACSELLRGNKECIIRNYAVNRLELRLFNARLCSRWMARCLWAAKDLGTLLEAQRWLMVA